MTTSLTLYLFPFICAGIGLLLAYLAVSVYVKAALRQQNDIAKKVGVWAEQQISPDAITQQLAAPSNIEKLLPYAEEHIDTFLRVKLPEAMPVLAMFVSDKLVAEMKAVFMTELKELFPALIQQYVSQLKQNISPGNLIAERLGRVSSDKLAHLLKKQLNIVYITAAITGFVSGCLYIFLTWIA